MLAADSTVIMETLKADMWKFFSRIKDNDSSKVKCEIYKKEFACHGTTSNMQDHLSRVHKDQYKKPTGSGSTQLSLDRVSLALSIPKHLNTFFLTYDEDHHRNAPISHQILWFSKEIYRLGSSSLQFLIIERGIPRENMTLSSTSSFRNKFKLLFSIDIWHSSVSLVTEQVAMMISFVEFWILTARQPSGRGKTWRNF